MRKLSLNLIGKLCLTPLFNQKVLKDTLKKLHSTGQLNEKRKRFFRELNALLKKHKDKAKRERISIVLRQIPEDDVILYPPLEVKDPNQPFGPPEAQVFEKMIRFTQIKHPYFISFFFGILVIDLL